MLKIVRDFGMQEMFHLGLVLECDMDEWIMRIVTGGIEAKTSF